MFGTICMVVGILSFIWLLFLVRTQFKEERNRRRKARSIQKAMPRAIQLFMLDQRETRDQLIRDWAEIHIGRF